MSSENVRPGDMVYYFNNCDEKNKPSPSIVLDVGNQGMLSLCCWSAAGGDSVTRRFVRHLEDPYFREFPERARETGGWRERSPVMLVPEEKAEAPKAQPRRATATKKG